MKSAKPQKSQYRQIFQQFQQITIDDFRIVGTLGVGTFGKVKLALFQKKQFRIPVALKILKKSQISQLNQEDHIRNEASILSQISFSFIVKLYSKFEDEENIYFVLEFVQGGELFKKLRSEGRFSQDVVMLYGGQILIAINFLHCKGITYRDLKPENLLISKSGNIKLADFGFAKKLDQRQRTKTMCGTPEYLAPEIIQGDNKGYNRAVDWWALGIIFYEMLVGFPPFYDKQTINIYKKIIKGVIHFPSFLSPVARDLIVRLLCPDWKLRLGASNNGQDIFEHSFFKSVSFDELRNRTIEAPWIPELRDELDQRYFEDNGDSDSESNELQSDNREFYQN